MSSKKEDKSQDDLIAERKRKRRQDMLSEESMDWGDGFDPVKMYLRRIGQVSLLDREGEVAIAKEIEAGREQIFYYIVNTRAGVGMVLDLPEPAGPATMSTRTLRPPALALALDFGIIAPQP